MVVNLKAYRDVRGTDAFGPLSRLGDGMLASQVGASVGEARGIWPGVATGVAVFLITRILDRIFFSGGR